MVDKMESTSLKADLRRVLRENISALESFRRFWQETKSPLMLWHYTTADGFYGIIREHSFRATDIYYFNDSSEVHYACELIVQALSQLTNKEPNPSLQVITPLWQEFSRFATGEKEFPFRMCAVCFCESGDLLSQWRGYGALGGGYALGFRTSDLLDFVSGVEGIWAMLPVLYDPREQRDLIQDTVNSACGTLNQNLEQRSVKSGNQEQSIELAETVVENLTARLLQYVAAFKRSSFREEKEWRIADIDLLDLPQNTPLQFRVRQGIIVPYRQLQLGNAEDEKSPRLPLSIVMKGPTLDRPLAVRSLRDVLRSHGYGDDVEIQVSEIPLRA